MLRLRNSARRLRKLLASGPADWWLMLRAQVELLKAQRLVRRVPRGELLATLAGRHSQPGAQPPDLQRAERIGLAVERVARFGIGRPLCLVRSIALHEMLERAGLTGSRIRIGVRMGPRGFEAHAWVELAGHVLGDEPTYVERFNPLADLSAVDRTIPFATAGL